jgi:hypothetical protein
MGAAQSAGAGNGPKACRNCGYLESQGARFCGVCGAAFDATQTVTPEEPPPGAPTDETLTAWPQPAYIRADSPGQPTAILPTEMSAGGRPHRRWPLIVAAIVLFLVVGGAAAALFATGVLPPSSGPTRLSDAEFAQALNSKAAQGLSRADAQASADLANDGGSANKIDADGAAIAAYANEAKTELPSTTNLSANQRPELQLVERFLTSNHHYGLALQQNSVSPLVSHSVVTAAAAVAAAERVARTAISGDSALPSAAVFALTAGTGSGPSHRGVPTGGLTPCDQNISVDPVTSCPFAENVFRAYVHSYRFNGKQSDVQVEAFSPVTHRPYSMDCFLTGRQTVDCTGGRKAFVTFPFRAAADD